jgi:pyridoxamine 5'-phosphate oxidase
MCSAKDFDWMMMTTEMTNLDDVLANAWQLMEQGVASRRHGFHHAAVATIGTSGLPRLRTVILRSANSQNNSLQFNTDVRSEKCKDLAMNANVSAIFYDEPSRTQVRVEGRASLHKTDELADASWAAAQPMSKINYGIMPEPGRVIDTPDGFTMPAPQTDVEWAREYFAVVKVQVQHLQWLYLRKGGQCCAVFDLRSGSKHWTVPS